MKVKLKKGIDKPEVRVIKFSTLVGGGVKHFITPNDVNCIKKGLNNSSPELLNLLKGHFGHTVVFRIKPEHKEKVLFVSPSFGGESQAFDCDGLIYSMRVTPEKDRNWKPAILGSTTGDCPHIMFRGDLLTDKQELIRIVGLIHSGWRGCAKNIVGVAMKQVIDNGGFPLKNLKIGLWGGICPKCYEVGEEVWKDLLPYHRHLHRGRDKKHWMLDLRGIITQQLIQAGIKPRQIETSMLCSHCQRERNGKHVLFSHRRGEADRNGLFISALAD